MSNEIVKFSNQFNNVALKKFDAVHLDVLMAIASRVREKGTATVEFSFEPTPYVMVISVNRREVLAFENGQALTSVHQTRNGGYCVRGAIPAGTNGTFSMQVEGNSTVINLEVSCYLPTPSGVIGAPVSTKRFPYSLPATMQANRPITIDQFDCGI